ncbi:M56 family metallopeptidase [uncultured Polaribacter sp.]|uniref:M56 family metallopeptidase n=1 Tax=uncultured Polaribacter sp. TaxID=174711 RepID=UPI002622ACA3|nr:M56 family metallopeptidase [uncultured Polaribacter sp.]
MEYFLKASVITFILYVFYIIVLQNDTFFQFNRIFLLVGVFTIFLIPFITIPVYIEYTPNFTTTSYSETSLIPLTTEHIEQPFKIVDYIPVIYLLGVLGFFIRFVLQFISLIRITKQNTFIKQEGFTVIKTNENILPFSFFKWIVYNSTMFSKEELEHILKHEKAHVKELHSIDIILTQLSCVVFWFNPFIWLYAKTVKENLEFIADEKAIKNTNCKKNYQYTLLKTSIKNKQLAISNNFYKSPIKKRIVMLQKTKSKKINQLKYALVIPVFALFLMNFNTEKVYIEKDSIKKGEIIEIVFNKNTTLDKLKNQSKIFKKKYNIDFKFEIENKDKKLADFKHSFYNGEQKHEATFLKVFPFKHMKHSLILKYNLETKLISMGSIVDDTYNESDYFRYLDNNSIGFYINNTETDKALRQFEKTIKEKGVIIEFLDIKRDANNRITEIKINAQTKDSKSSYNYKLDGKNFNGISISFYSNGNGLEIKPVLNTF